MIYQTLGKTNINVSKICFGSLTMGPLQKNLTIREGADLIRYGFERGINFIDMAELYETYPYMGEALKTIPRSEYVIASKCYAYTEQMAEESLKAALDGLGTDYIDIFMLHEQMNDMTLKGHGEAIDYFIKMKQKGVIRAFGISTHYVAAVKAALKHPEIEVIHPITNIGGLGIQDGSIDDMVEALNHFRANGGGVYGMKPFGGGNLLKQKDLCYDFVFNAPFLDAVAFGMQSKDEIDQNVNRLLGIETSKDISERLSKQTKRLEVSDWCIKCGACVKRCDHHALTMTETGLHINRDKCVMCGYCASVCPEFCLKVY
jgi:aryl-alcohol dehydrogenase-like predicted oxidoreductase